MNAKHVFIACAVLMGCSSSPSEKWEMIEDAGDAALFLDSASVTRVGPMADFKTKYSSTASIKLGNDRAELRRTQQIDCTAQTFVTLDGGLYLDGKKLSPLARLASGKIPSKGFMREIERRVC